MSQEIRYEILLTSATSSLEHFTLPTATHFSSEKGCHCDSIYIFSSESHCLLVSLSFSLSVFSGASLTPFIHLSSRAPIYTLITPHAQLPPTSHPCVCFFFLTTLKSVPPPPVSSSLAFVCSRPLLSRSSLSPQGGD